MFDFVAKDTRIINLLAKENRVQYDVAVRLWMTSKTRAFMLSEGLLNLVGDTRCVSELKMELSNDERWLLGTF